MYNTIWRVVSYMPSPQHHRNAAETNVILIEPNQSLECRYTYAFRHVTLALDYIPRYLASTTRPSPSFPAPTYAVLPLLTSPLIILSASAFPISFEIRRLSGLAP